MSSKIDMGFICWLSGTAGGCFYMAGILQEIAAFGLIGIGLAILSACIAFEIDVRADLEATKGGA